MRAAGRIGHLLILGGTEDALALARALRDVPGLAVTTSLAGRTGEPVVPAGEMRTGGFGGLGAMCHWLSASGITLVVDATHPFAIRISTRAALACGELGLPLLRLERPSWAPRKGDRWLMVRDLAEALAVLPRLAQRVFAVIGRREIERLGSVPEVGFVARSIEPPSDLPANVEWIAGRGPFARAEEEALLRRHGIEAVLCRASGGRGGYAKIEAARALQLPVVMLQRPPPPPDVPTAANVADVVAWLDRTLRVEPV